MMMEYAEERRRYPRVDCRAAVQYRELHRPRELYAGGLARNISAGGVRFEAGRFFARQHRLVLPLSLPGVGVLIRAIARVVWIGKQPRNDQYDVGAQFIEIAPGDRDVVADYVERGVQTAWERPVVWRRVR